jgi:hypothetical protein
MIGDSRAVESISKSLKSKTPGDYFDEAAEAPSAATGSKLSRLWIPKRQCSQRDNAQCSGRDEQVFNKLLVWNLVLQLSLHRICRRWFTLDAAGLTEPSAVAALMTVHSAALGVQSAHDKRRLFSAEAQKSAVS